MVGPSKGNSKTKPEAKPEPNGILFRGIRRHYGFKPTDDMTVGELGQATTFLLNLMMTTVASVSPMHQSQLDRIMTSVENQYDLYPEEVQRHFVVTDASDVAGPSKGLLLPQ